MRERLQKMCAEVMDGHWVLDGSSTIRLRSGAVVTTKRAIYVSFIGDVPEDHDVRMWCGLASCHAPDHMRLSKSRRAARALSANDLIDTVGSVAKKGESKQPSVQVPRETADFVVNSTLPLRQLQAATGLPLGTIVKIKNGEFGTRELVLTGQGSK